jgi:hypothetical protein
LADVLDVAKVAFNGDLGGTVAPHDKEIPEGQPTPSVEDWQ